MVILALINPGVLRMLTVTSLLWEQCGIFHGSHAPTKSSCSGRNFLSAKESSRDRREFHEISEYGPLLIHSDELLLAAMNKYWRNNGNMDI